MKANRRVAVVTVGLGTLMQGAVLRAAPPVVTLTRIADWNTPIPKGEGNFTAFGLTVGMTTNEAVFMGAGGSGQGIYGGDGEALRVIVAPGTPIPGGKGTFERLWEASVGDESIYFHGFGDGQEGIYRCSHGVLTAVADGHTQMPGSLQRFEEFFAPSAHGSRVAFAGSARDMQGVYRYDGGSLAVVAHRGMTTPAGDSEFFGFEGNPAVWDDRVAFWAYTLGRRSGEGIYVFDGASDAIRVIADRQTPIPGGSGHFDKFDTSVSLWGATAAFHGWDDGELQQGIYASVNGRLEVVADLNTAIPDGEGTFTRVRNPVVYGTNIAFTGEGADGQKGVYARVAGTLIKVLDLNDPLDGREVEHVLLWNGGILGNRLGFWVYFRDPHEGDGIYVADVSGVQCSDREKLKVDCRQDGLRARTRRGLSDVTLTFCLNDEQCQLVQVKPNGRARAKWSSPSPGRHVVEVRECELKRRVDCP